MEAQKTCNNLIFGKKYERLRIKTKELTFFVLSAQNIVVSYLLARSTHPNGVRLAEG